MAKTKERIEDIKQRMQDVAQILMGLPLVFRPTKSVPHPASLRSMRDMAAPLCDSCRVEIVAPTGFSIDIGQIAFDGEQGNVFAVANTPTINALFDKMDPKDRF